MRRVVTGYKKSRAVFVLDEQSPHKFAAEGYELGVLWGTSGIADVLSQPADPALNTLLTVPTPGNTLCQYCVVPPMNNAPSQNLRSENAVATDFHMETDDLKHTTDTIDYGVILKGELWLDLDDGETCLLRTGDSFIQNGTRHSWRNASASEAVIFFVMVGATRNMTS
jgi:hypothetical protein